MEMSEEGGGGWMKDGCYEGYEMGAWGVLFTYSVAIDATMLAVIER